MHRIYNRIGLKKGLNKNWKLYKVKEVNMMDLMNFRQ